MELSVDTETGRFGTKNNAYSSDALLVSIHTYNGCEAHSYDINHREQIHQEIQEASLLIGFNFKFDLSFLRRNSILPYVLPPIWDVQLAHFILMRQTARMPSLNSVLEHYNIPLKLDVVKTEFWDKGIETEEIPWNILCEYGEYDTIATYKAYLKQKEEFKEKPLLYKLFKIQCQDLLVLHEMEWNGLKYNNKLCKETSEKLQLEINTIVRELSSLYPDVPINFNSNDQLSAYIYGGNIKEDKRHLAGYYKTGGKEGQPRFTIEHVEHALPRLVTPLRGSEMSKEGVYATDEATLKKLKGKKELVDKLLKLSKLLKLKETYYEGMNKLNKEMNWPEGKLHPNYNQCVAQTGRLSSAKP